MKSIIRIHQNGKSSWRVREASIAAAAKASLTTSTTSSSNSSSSKSIPWKDWNLWRGSIVALSIILVLGLILLRKSQARRPNAYATGLIFPIYHTIIISCLVLECLTVALLVVYHGHLPLALSALCWALSRLITEGLTIFLLHHGVGIQTIRRSFFYAGVWSITSFVVWYYVPILRDEQGATASHALLFTYLSLLLFFYLVLAVAPPRIIARRPALLPVALLMSLLLALHIIKEILDISVESEPLAWNIISLMLWAAYPWVIYHALVMDSQWWQGLYTSRAGQGNLNEPLVGTWGGLLNRPASVLASLMSYLEMSQDVALPSLIPFGQIRLRMDLKFRSGSNSRVYVGELHGKQVAVKMLFILELDAEAIQEFYEEARVLASLRHPNIIDLVGISIMPPALTLITEYASHGSLYEFLSKYKNKGPEEAAALLPLTRAKLMLDCIAGLEHVHQKGWVHSDIKSLNYLVNSDFQVKLSDVGECRGIGSEANEGGIAGGGGGVGVIHPKTLNWCCPEILAGRATRYLPEQDIYSLGLVLYEILTFQVPFNHEPYKSMSLQDFVHEVVTLEKRPHLPSHIDMELQMVIRRCWDSKPEVRPTASELYSFMKQRVENMTMKKGQEEEGKMEATEGGASGGIVALQQ